MHEVYNEENLSPTRDKMKRKLTDYTERERGLGTREKVILDKENRLSVAMEEQRRKLESIAGLTAEEAKRQLYGQMEEEARREAALLVMRLDEEARETAQVRELEVIATTI